MAVGALNLARRQAIVSKLSPPSRSWWGSSPYYLAHREQIDAYLQLGEEQLDALRQAARDADPMWYQKLKEARRSAA
jgi:hypothetical protein